MSTLPTQLPAQPHRYREPSTYVVVALRVVLAAPTGGTIRTRTALGPTLQHRRQMSLLSPLNTRVTVLLSSCSLWSSRFLAPTVSLILVADNYAPFGSQLAYACAASKSPIRSLPHVSSVRRANARFLALVPLRTLSHPLRQFSSSCLLRLPPSLRLLCPDSTPSIFRRCSILSSSARLHLYSNAHSTPEQRHSSAHYRLCRCYMRVRGRANKGSSSSLYAFLHCI